MSGRLVRPADEEPDYEEALAAYVAAHPESPDAGLQRALDAPAAPADIAGIQVRPHVPTRAEQISDTVAKGGDLTPFITQPAPDARPPAVERPGSAEATLTAMQTRPGPDARTMPQPFRAPPPTPEGEALLSDLETAGKRSAGLEDQPLPDASMPVAGVPPPAQVPAGLDRPSVQVRKAAHVDVPNTAVVQSAARPGGAPVPAGPGGVDPVRRALTALALSAQPQGQGDLDAALQAAAGRRLVAGLARAGGAMVGRGQGAGYDALDREADRPVEEFQARRGLAADERQQAALKAAADAARQKESFQEEMGRGELEVKRGELDVKRKAEALKERRGGGPKPLTPTQELQREKFDQSLREKASKDAEGASELSDTLDRLEGALKSNDLPGVGRVVGRLAAVGVGSDAGIRMRSDLQRLADVILRARSGAAVTPSEAERLAIESGTSSGATEQQVRIATQTAVNIMRRAERNLRAKYPGATWEQLADQGGWTPGAKATSSGGPTQIHTAEEYNALPAGAEYIDPNGKHKRKGGG